MTTYTITVSEIKFNNNHTIELHEEDILEVQGYWEEDFFQIDSVNWITADNDISNDLVSILHNYTLNEIREKVAEKVSDDYINQQAADYDNAYDNYRDNKGWNENVY